MTTERLDQRATDASDRESPILVNGVERFIRPGITLQELAVVLGIADEPRGIAIALDGVVVPRTDWAGTAIATGARVEVVRAGAGG